MTLLLLTACLLLAIALLPCAMVARNLQLFQAAPSDPNQLSLARNIPVSVLIPARNEEASIRHSLDALTKSNHATFEVLVLDDASEDQTANIVEEYSRRFPFIQLHRSTGLTPGWNGKQNACWQLANLASYDRLLFLDADVRLAPDALTRILAEQELRNAPLVSGFPFQETGTFAEKLLIPMMHFVLLGYLPIDRMRASSDPGFAAGCGQLFLAKKQAYFQTDGHRAIAPSRHDGIKLPRAFRKAGLTTDIFDASDIAKCRMYQSLSQVQQGLLKNATEGIANKTLIVPFTVLLLGSSTIPLCLGAYLTYGLVANRFAAAQSTTAQSNTLASTPTLVLISIAILALATIIGWTPRWMTRRAFHQSTLGALLHPFAVAWFIALQWIALIRKALRWQTPWRGRLDTPIS